ncbi:MAG: isopentenyl phosphate kinase [Candidatus Hodarchaeales archaeon]|jgi:isopentenyl phosphate kinase
MPEIDLLLKVGGSVLTDKHKTGVIREELIIKVSSILKKLYDREIKLAIVTGVGSPGHQAVYKYSTHKGDDGSLYRRVGLVEAQVKVNSLRNIFLKVLGDAGIPALQYYTSSIATADKMVPTSFNLDPVENYLSLGFVPVTTGDVVADATMGFSVMSGDIAMWQIAKRWKPKIIAYGTDVAGIFNGDPKERTDVRLIEDINSKMIADVSKNVTEGATIDVSGAMQGKLKVIMAMLEENPSTKVHIFDLTVPENLIKIVNGEPFEHTVVHH